MSARSKRYRKIRKRRIRRLKRELRDRQSLRHQENVVKDAMRRLTADPVGLDFETDRGALASHYSYTVSYSRYAKGRK